MSDASENCPSSKTYKREQTQMNTAWHAALHCADLERKNEAATSETAPHVKTAHIALIFQRNLNQLN